MAPVSGDGRPDVDGDDRPGEAPPPQAGDEPSSAAKPEPPYQALFPNLDRVSRSSFDKGTVSRRRINRALAVLALVAAVIVLAAILVPLLIR